jgi:hypothetical protein
MSGIRNRAVVAFLAALAVLLATDVSAALIEHTWTVTYKSISPDGVEKVSTWHDAS